MNLTMFFAKQVRLLKLYAQIGDDTYEGDEKKEGAAAAEPPPAAEE